MELKIEVGRRLLPALTVGTLQISACVATHTVFFDTHPCTGSAGLAWRKHVFAQAEEGLLRGVLYLQDAADLQVPATQWLVEAAQRHYDEIAALEVPLEDAIMEDSHA